MSFLNLRIIYRYLTIFDVFKCSDMRLESLYNKIGIGPSDKNSLVKIVAKNPYAFFYGGSLVLKVGILL